MPKLLKLPFLFLLACVALLIHLVACSLALLVLLPLDLVFSWARGCCVVCHDDSFPSLHSRFFGSRPLAWVHRVVWSRSSRLGVFVSAPHYHTAGIFDFLIRYTPPFAPLYRNCRYDGCRPGRAYSQRIAEQERAHALTPEQAYAERSFAEVRATDDSFARRVSDGTW